MRIFDLHRKTKDDLPAGFAATIVWRTTQAPSVGCRLSRP
jgi:hypothetical protein